MPKDDTLSEKVDEFRLKLLACHTDLDDFLKLAIQELDAIRRNLEGLYEIACRQDYRERTRG